MREKLSEHKWVVQIFVAERPDGGMRVWSDELPGLVLSGPDPSAVGADIFRAIQVLREYKAEAGRPLQDTKP